VKRDVGGRDNLDKKATTVRYNLHFIKRRRENKKKSERDRHIMMNRIERHRRVAISTRPTEGVQLSNMHA